MTKVIPQNNSHEIYDLKYSKIYKRIITEALTKEQENIWKVFLPNKIELDKKIELESDNKFILALKYDIFEKIIEIKKHNVIKEFEFEIWWNDGSNSLKVGENDLIVIGKWNEATYHIASQNLKGKHCKSIDEVKKILDRELVDYKRTKLRNQVAFFFLLFAVIFAWPIIGLLLYQGEFDTDKLTLIYATFIGLFLTNILLFFTVKTEWEYEYNRIEDI